MSDSDDPCNTSSILLYKKRDLQGGKAETSVVRYRFEEAQKTFVVDYYRERREARVVKIICNKEGDEKCKPFAHDLLSVRSQRQTQKVVGNWNSTEVEIDNVNMGEAKGSGHCSTAVSYMLKVLLLESAKEGEFPYNGEVYLSSNNPCAAIQCYTHAFANNGFSVDKDELKKFKTISFQKISKEKGVDGIDYDLKGFFNKSQKEKYDKKARQFAPAPRATILSHSDSTHQLLKY